MALLSDVKNTIKNSLENIQPIRKAMKIQAGKEMFILVSVNQSYELTNYGTNRQTGTFNFEFLLVPEADSTPPADTFSVIMEYFQTTTLKEFKTNNVTLISYAFDSGELVTDPTTGYVSLSFSINIVATQKQ
ncbi:hypothetical protein E0539_11785 [Salmonella enterica subsp. enterica serovar Tilene]|uniref:hypothetical protein n=1 Tax=Salmonella enterica TaxID=28901 RepID=UPI00128078D1|nr:hypothetical protein [Salmonella enterica]EBZ5874355.1 hypothetical protein [Salmonella enterica subsp. enterica serovar Millesi]ECF1326715.1 hypothetical protein [Salmonella enterica subsp. enterica serovar Tilene]EEL5713518.1 hypothetical protein [Salmonella enterica subsp. enterica serovar Rubislaw]HCB5333322.1 hypothetical protein [Salmonella enterica subsp. enterica serovar Rubislaw]HCB5341614.1 hypothetical protein [Salmonella enterica subsp. enterica serovar Rubislaw]